MNSCGGSLSRSISVVGVVPKIPSNKIYFNLSDHKWTHKECVRFAGDRKRPATICLCACVLVLGSDVKTKSKFIKIILENKTKD